MAWVPCGDLKFDSLGKAITSSAKKLKVFHYEETLFEFRKLPSGKVATVMIVVLGTAFVLTLGGGGVLILKKQGYSLPDLGIPDLSGKDRGSYCLAATGDADEGDDPLSDIDCVTESLEGGESLVGGPHSTALNAGGPGSGIRSMHRPVGAGASGQGVSA